MDRRHTQLQSTADGGAYSVLEMRFVMLTLRGVGLVGVALVGVLSMELEGLGKANGAMAEGLSPEGWWAVMLAATALRCEIHFCRSLVSAARSL